MSYPQQPGGWTDPSWSSQPHSPQPEQTYPASGQPGPAQPVPTQPMGNDPYATGYPAPGYPPAGYQYGYAAAPRTNSMALVAMILSIVGVVSCITAPIGAILGHVARKQIQQSGESGEGMAKAAIIVGWILTGLLLLLITFYIVMIVIAVSSSSGGFD